MTCLQPHSCYRGVVVATFLASVILSSTGWAESEVDPAEETSIQFDGDSDNAGDPINDPAKVPGDVSRVEDPELFSVLSPVVLYIQHSDRADAGPIEIRDDLAWSPAVQAAPVFVRVQATQDIPPPPEDEATDAAQPGAADASQDITPPADEQQQQETVGTLFPRSMQSATRPTTQETSGVASDAGSILKGRSGESQGTAVGSRTPIVHGTIMRGRRLGQLAATGSHWFPVRMDMDTILSKIDSDLVREIVSVKGPYSALHGPGLAVYDIELLGAPRFDYGFESHGKTVLDYQTNGEQWHGRTSYWGGSSDWGFRIGYGHRTGSDYETGGGFELPTSYNSRNPDFAFGVDPLENHHLDFNYLRLDQTNLEFPGQFYDINFLVTDGYDLRYVWEDGPFFNRLSAEGWYNQSRFEGDTSRPGKRRQISFLNQFRVDSETAAENSSTGYSVALSWGDPGVAQLTFGTDLRFLQQSLLENTTFGQLPPGVQSPLGIAVIPPAESSNPGLFLEGELPMTQRLSIRSGARMDWVSTNAVNTFDLGGSTPVDLESVLHGTFDRQFDLWSAFVTAEYELNQDLTALAGFGYAMRAPTMTELYAVGPFIAALPQFAFTTLFGNPNLKPERLRQIDIGLQADHGWLRGGVNSFYAWVDDYITYDYLSPPTGSLYGLVNTDRATLSGGEFFSELDVSHCLTAFATLSYVEGRDQTRSTNRSPVCEDFFLTNLCDPDGPRSSSLISPAPTSEEPLPVIPPLQSRVGFIIHEPAETPLWSLELSARIVDADDRVATSLREEQTPGFATYDARGYWQAFDDLLLTGGVLNLTDRFYQEFFDSRLGLTVPVYQPGRSFYFGFELTY